MEDGLPLDAAVRNAAGDSVEAKETLLAVTRRECITSHIIRSRWLRVRKKRPLSDDQECVPGRPRLTVDLQNAHSYQRQGSCTLLMCRVFRNDPVLHDRRPGPILAEIVMEYHRAWQERAEKAIGVIVWRCACGTLSRRRLTT